MPAIAITGPAAPVWVSSVRATMNEPKEELQFRALFDGAPDGIIVVDASGSIVAVNAMIEPTFGYRREELIGESIELLVPESLRSMHSRDRGAYVANPRPRPMAAGRIVAGRKKDGTKFPVEISLSTVPREGGVLVMGVVRDLTEHVRAEEHFNRFFNLSLDYLALSGVDGYLKRINPVWAQSLGFTTEELLSRPLLDLVEPDDRAEAATALETLRNGVDVIALVTRLTCRDGSWRAVQWNARPVVAEGIIYGVGRDITERRRTDAALRETAHKLQTIFDSTPVALLGLDLAGRVTSWSAGAERMFGWSAEETIGQPCPTVPPDEMESFLSMIERVTRFGSQTGITARSQKQSGEIINANLGAAPLVDSAGRAGGVTVVMEDITERVRAQETLRAYSGRLRLLSQQLVRAQEAERRRIARELHDEIGQALAAVEINLRVAKGSPEMTRLAPALEESVGILERVLQQIRDLSVDLHPPMLEQLGLEAALRWHVDRQTQRAGLAARIVLTSLERRPPPEVELACFRVAQEAVTNVIRHAEATRVDVELKGQGDGLELVVRDDGGGFDIARARAARGTLGLVGMEERVSFLGGQFTIDSSPERGTEIRALFPLGTE